MILYLIFLLIGCASHTPLESLLEQELSEDLPYCDLIPEVGQSQLDNLLAPYKEHLDSGMTGVSLQENGGNSLAARSWLMDHATESLDVQYFIFAADVIGMIVTDSMLLAAERGVKVRLLVDDTLTHGDANLLLAMDAHPNFEVRIYNPNINIGKSFATKIENVLTDFRGINQRMHNKTFIVDGKASITGGRNIGDEYFDFNEDYNFRDRDVLLFGGITSDIQTSFDQFWVDELSVPISTILKLDLPDSPENIWKKLHQFGCDPNNYHPTSRTRVTQFPLFVEQLVERGQIHWVDEAIFLSDEPGKNDEVEGLGGGGISTTALIGIVEKASESIVIQTPYLILSEKGLALFKRSLERGVSVKIMTNSLAATDNFPAFKGYSDIRTRLLDMGVELYEFKPKAKLRRKIMRGRGAGVKKRSSLGLHAKSMVIDKTRVMVGTFNLDPRSANLNTECITLFDSPKLAAEALSIMEEEMKPENSWQPTKDDNPDAEAGVMALFQTWLSGLIPKELL